MSEYTVDELKLLIEYDECQLDVIIKRLAMNRAKLKELEDEH